MTIEALLETIVENQKLILVALQSGAQMASAPVASNTEADAAETTKRTRRTKAQIEADAAAEAKQKEEEEAAAAAAAKTPSTSTVTAAGKTEGETTWDQAVAALKTLAADPAHGSGAVVKVIQLIDPTAANVPALKDKGVEARIVEEVNKLLHPASTGDAADPLFG